jgi:hypothetical protein
MGQVADRCRAFLCPRSAEKSVEHCVCALGGPDSSLFRCLACGHDASASEVRAYVAQEAAAQAALRAVEELEELGQDELVEARLAIVDKQALLRPEHHLRFQALERRALRALDAGSASMLQLWTQVFRCADLVLPERHHERVMFLDRLAQVQFKQGNQAEAKATYARALQCAIDCSGPPHLSLLSRQLQQLVDNMPSTLQQLVDHYRRRDEKSS